MCVCPDFWATLTCQTDHLTCLTVLLKQIVTFLEHISRSHTASLHTLLLCLNMPVKMACVLTGKILYSKYFLVHLTFDPTVLPLVLVEVEGVFMMGPFFPALHFTLNVSDRLREKKPNYWSSSAVFSMHYMIINHAINLMHLTGRGVWSARADIMTTFKLSICPNYFAVLWNDTDSVSVHLTSECNSSPLKPFAEITENS